MISKAVTTVLLAGFVAGILVTGAQMLKVTPLILQAEKYEVGTEVVPHTHEQSGITHEHELNGVALDVHASMKDAHAAEAVSVDHSDESWVPENGAERTFYTGSFQHRYRNCFQLNAGCSLSAAWETGQYELRPTLGRSRFFDLLRISSIGSCLRNFPE